MNSEHLPASETSWLGDSIGWWEGDTLVIDSTNFNSKARNRGASENVHVVERFTRLEDGKHEGQHATLLFAQDSDPLCVHVVP